MPSPEHERMAQFLDARDTAATREEQRQGYDGLSLVYPLADDIRVEEVSAGGVPAEWVVAPEADAERVLLYLHGGGYVIGSRLSHRELASRLSRQTRARVLLIDYRLAPESPFPAALQDATASYRFLLGSGVDPARLAIGGDSAGGGLTMATLIHLRDRGIPLPAAAILLSPWVDLRMTGDSARPRAVHDPVCRLADLHDNAALYAAGKLDDPLVSPLYGDLHGLPPVLIQVGTREILLDDATRLAAKLEAAGVLVKLDTQEGLMHVWQQFAATAPEAASAVERLGRFVREACP